LASVFFQSQGQLAGSIKAVFEHGGFRWRGLAGLSKQAAPTVCVGCHKPGIRQHVVDAGRFGDAQLERKKPLNGC
jgi:hypothetical protein